MESYVKETSAFKLKVHHIKFAVNDVLNFSSMLVNNLKFKVLATKHENDQEISVYEHGLVKFLVEDRKKLNANNYSSLYSDMNSYPADTAYDVCLECNNIEQIVNSVNSHMSFSQNVKIFNMFDDNGIVKFAVVKSPIGNIYHTLVELSNYNGKFLPGFKVCEENISNTADLISHIDHIAVCLNVNQTESVYNWYAHCFGFKRALINQDDHREDGFVVEQKHNGLRLKEVVCPSMLEETTYTCKQGSESLTRIVFAESLKNDKSNPTNVDNFIINHGGPGVQHLAFGCNDLFKTANVVNSSQIDCVKYPLQYYEDLIDSKTVKNLGIKVDDLKKGNVLLEYHSPKVSKQCKVLQSDKTMYSLNFENQLKVIEDTEWYILQMFTKPVFNEKTLFFEFIQRSNTLTGLGASNISTIWKYQAADIDHRSIYSLKD